MRIVATGRIGRPSYIRIFDVDASVVIGMSTTELATALVAGSGLGKLPASFARANSDKSEYWGSSGIELSAPRLVPTPSAASPIIAPNARSDPTHCVPPRIAALVGNRVVDTVEEVDDVDRESCRIEKCDPSIHFLPIPHSPSHETQFSTRIVAIRLGNVGNPREIYRSLG